MGDDRRAGWRDAVARHGLGPGPEAVCEQDITDAGRAAAPMLERLGEAGAIVCASDAIALGVLHAALARGWRPGPDIGIVGFDGSAMAEMSGLTTVVQPLDEIADHLLALVHDLLAGGSSPAAGELFRPSLRLGRSSVRAEGR